MDAKKIGVLLRELRKEHGMTQRELANVLCVSDKTISKWERGNGCPEVSLLSAISKVFNVDIHQLLNGELEKKIIDGGNMRNLKFYTCPTYHNMITSLTDCDMVCCGKKIQALQVYKSDEFHALRIENVEDDYYITLNHPMTKEHYISSIAYVMDSGFLMTKLYPEQCAAIRIPRLRGGKFFVYCKKDGLFEINPA